MSRQVPRTGMLISHDLPPSFQSALERLVVAPRCDHRVPWRQSCNDHGMREYSYFRFQRQKSKLWDV